jgi:hypothetical protein
MRYTEGKTGRTYSTTYEWSSTLHQAVHHHRYWKLMLQNHCHCTVPCDKSLDPLGSDPNVGENKGQRNDILLTGCWDLQG